MNEPNKNNWNVLVSCRDNHGVFYSSKDAVTFSKIRKRKFNDKNITNEAFKLDDTHLVRISLLLKYKNDTYISEDLIYTEFKDQTIESMSLADYLQGGLALNIKLDENHINGISKSILGEMFDFSFFAKNILIEMLRTLSNIHSQSIVHLGIFADQIQIVPLCYTHDSLEFVPSKDLMTSNHYLYFYLDCYEYITDNLTDKERSFHNSFYKIYPPEFYNSNSNIIPSNLLEKQDLWDLGVLMAFILMKGNPLIFDRISNPLLLINPIYFLLPYYNDNYNDNTMLEIVKNLLSDNPHDRISAADILNIYSEWINY